MAIHKIRQAFVYGGAAALSLAFGVWALGLWRANLGVPLYYLHHEDAFWSNMLVKGIVDNGWYLHNPYLGAPGEFFHQDFPMPENLHFLVIRTLALFSSTPGVVMNGFFLLTFPLITVSALFVFRAFGISNFAGVPASILYALLPGHFMRGENHLLLSAYYLVPLMTMVCLWVCSGRVRRIRLGCPEAAISVAVCALMGGGGVYYAFFGCFFLIVSAVIAFSRTRCSRTLLAPVLLIGILTGSQIANLAPSLIYFYTEGYNPEAVIRDGTDGEMYSLRIAQLILPVTDHRVPFFARVKAAYNSVLGFRWYNESDSASLGLVGACGFLALLGAIFWIPAIQRASLFADLVLLNAAAVLLGTASGFGSLLALLAIHRIRTYNRISMYIAFFALYAVALVVDRVWRVCAGRVWRQAACIGLLATLLVAGALDQTIPQFIPDYPKLNDEFASDAAIVKQIEAEEPKGAMIFELPYVAFPEGRPVYQMAESDLFRGYLHSHTLHWSYGATKGRPVARWQKSVADKPPSDFVQALASRGFDGIYIARDGYPDHAAKIEMELSAVLKAKPLISRNGAISFFDMSRYRSHEVSRQ